MIDAGVVTKSFDEVYIPEEGWDKLFVNLAKALKKFNSHTYIYKLGGRGGKGVLHIRYIYSCQLMLKS